MTKHLTFILLVLLPRTASTDLVRLEPETGRSIASIEWKDETGRTRETTDLSGYPLILLPIYTRCPTACVQNVDRLKEALANSTNDISQTRVLLFSFDPSDDPDTLTKYRRVEKIPAGWLIAATSQANIDTFLDSIGIPVGRAGKEFTHPNILIFLDAKLRIAKWIYGTDYTTRDIDLAWQVAMGRKDWIGQHSDMLYALLLFSASILCVVLVSYLRQLHGLRGLNTQPPSSAHG